MTPKDVHVLIPELRNILPFMAVGNKVTNQQTLKEGEYSTHYRWVQCNDHDP